MSQRSQTSCFRLTARESEVFRLIASGLSAKEVAQTLAIATCTVERHIENVRLKTRTRNRAHMVAYVIGEGLLDNCATGMGEAVAGAQRPAPVPPIKRAT